MPFWIEQFKNIRETPKVYGIPAHYNGRPVINAVEKGTAKFKDTIASKTSAITGNKNVGSRTMVKYQRKKKRSSKGRRRIRRAIPTIQKPTQLVRLKVSQRGSITGTAGAIASYPIVMNGVADPFLTLGTEQPLGLDQWASLYRKYVVVGAKVISQVYSTSTTGGATAIGLSIQDSTTALTDIEHYRESPYTAIKILSPDQDHTGLAMKFRTKSHFRAKNLLDKDELHGTLDSTGASHTDPSDLKYCHFFIQDLVGSDTSVMEHITTIEYIVLLFDRVLPSRSTA